VLGRRREGNGAKNGMERQPTTFQATRWRGAEREKGEAGPCGHSHVEEEGRGGGLWRGGRQRGAADNGPWPSGAGDSVATRTGKGAGASDTVRAADAQARVRWGTRCQRQGAEERERGRERSGDDRVPTGRPGQHSAGAAIQTVF
jgi:hypothetical protein